VTRDHFALASDGVKYSPIAADKDGDRDKEVPEQTANDKCLETITASSISVQFDTLLNQGSQRS